MSVWNAHALDTHDWPELAGDALHLWWLALDAAAAGAFALDAVPLTAEETRPIRPELRRARAWLRLILARYLGCDAAALAFAREAKGRPYLVAPATALRFSLAHSGERMLLAVGHRRCGVDLESLAKPRNYAALARGYFGPEELAWFDGAGPAGAAAAATAPRDSATGPAGAAAAPTVARTRRFLRLWTAKEALLKANGLGISDGLRAVRLAVRADGSLVPVALPAIAGDPATWTLVELEPEPGYCAALATLGPAPVLGRDCYSPRPASAGNSID